MLLKKCCFILNHKFITVFAQLRNKLIYLADFTNQSIVLVQFIDQTNPPFLFLFVFISRIEFSKISSSLDRYLARKGRRIESRFHTCAIQWRERSVNQAVPTYRFDGECQGRFPESFSFMQMRGRVRVKRVIGRIDTEIRKKKKNKKKKKKERSQSNKWKN